MGQVMQEIAGSLIGNGTVPLSAPSARAIGATGTSA
jgi:hypothetical protein